MSQIERRDPGFWNGPNAGMLIPLTALSIPIVAILSDDVAWVLAPVVLIAAVTIAIRHLMLFRHRLKLDEIAAQERLALAERERYSAIENVLEREGLPRDRHDI